jgi:hypothetical protein
MVNKFKSGVLLIDAQCRQIASTLLMKGEKKRLYDQAEFAALQADHRAQVCLQALTLLLLSLLFFSLKVLPYSCYQSIKPVFPTVVMRIILWCLTIGTLSPLFMSIVCIGAFA